MSLDAVIDKLLISLKKEFNKEKNQIFLEDEILKPVVYKIMSQLYPYCVGFGLFFLFMFIFIMIILVLNVKIFLHK